MKSSAADWGVVVKRRSEMISTVCKDRGDSHVSTSELVLDRILVSDQHGILFCETPEASDAYWKKLLIAVGGSFSSAEDVPEHLVHDHQRNGLPRLSSLAPEEITHRLKTYFKFIVVRDPFERLITTFEDKFLFNKPSEPWYKHTISPAIIHKYRTDFPFLADAGLVFDEFVRYLGDAEGRSLLDWQFGEHIIHWATYVELCAPCDISYDVIGHHETLERDAAHILRKAAIEHLVSYPAIPPGVSCYNKTKVERYFSGISKRDIRRLYERYQGDFHLFGYPTPDFLLN
ncbi:carbohydrate sulfotransferase 10-like isoform X3 [Dunckerocampus dactyliophorus]|uniref:carbohydrate sulfotransferase 10-like isoform X2 n=1 Tax=Dunckerocampus dactyliophorus TaxID=161453 RepID=UPI002405921D|nr:carbohydrate sulfotransferase 10-like isoform X2 [Dunckerocampus dactyliophorus]XP_054630951.1 carbohydrate sulfotransferase 10-like isoform X2 [Dunckerocampus dactyliophorus]XP_054631032.1 carbohydrate sulfotransferase 10-like isoform X3 [Dunckerocampus dactyliophorus]